MKTQKTVHSFMFGRLRRQSAIYAVLDSGKPAALARPGGLKFIIPNAPVLPFAFSLVGKEISDFESTS